MVGPSERRLVVLEKQTKPGEGGDEGCDLVHAAHGARKERQP